MPGVCPGGCLFIFFNFFGGSNNAWQIHKFASINKKLWSVARRNKMAEAQGTDYYTYEDGGRSAFGGRGTVSVCALLLNCTLKSDTGGGAQKDHERRRQGEEVAGGWQADRAKLRCI